MIMKIRMKSTRLGCGGVGWGEVHTNIFKIVTVVAKGINKIN